MLNDIDTFLLYRRTQCIPHECRTHTHTHICDMRYAAYSDRKLLEWMSYFMLMFMIILYLLDHCDVLKSIGLVQQGVAWPWVLYTCEQCLENWCWRGVVGCWFGLFVLFSWCEFLLFRNWMHFICCIVHLLLNLVYHVHLRYFVYENVSIRMPNHFLWIAYQMNDDAECCDII